MFKKTGIVVLLLLIFSVGTSVLSCAQDKQEAPLDEYTKVITGRADEIVDAIEFAGEEEKTQVRDIIVEHYRFLNDAEEARNEDVAKIREEYADNKELRDAKIDLRKAEQELKVRDHHFAFCPQLKQIATEEQIDQIKDGLTYNVLNVTYVAMQEMVPSLTDEEKKQIYVWLLEAREHAIDGGSSKDKHGWFGKYKGRINNYLSARGYDLQKERENWEKRLEEQKKN
ncbi:DUF3826 domain-containing protein [Prolixibacteraceae bacterium Z1-6]|uniref:DUF3826 domain-containing protein n=1 Tax=Draconibacterium aestuarii TaxID=2998507 RepID=A0A9X3FF68_9BACT|nr:DUF3826 domain-containing protein [Prolixibacteraceae bacterium Z1-6]